MYEKLCFSNNKSTPSLWVTQYVCVCVCVCVWVGGRMCLLVSQCVCASADDTIAWLASGSRRVMQKLLVVLLIPLCQCHKKRHQSSDTGGADHPPLLVSGLAQTHRSEWEDYYAAHMMSVLKKNHRSETILHNSSGSLRAVNTDMKN